MTTGINTTQEEHQCCSLSPRERVRVRGYHKGWHPILTAHLQKSQKPLIVILGPTASGKTAFSLEMAKWIKKAELINADSRQLYKYMDIGTAKITERDMAGIPHHLFSILDPKEKVTVGWYKQTAEKVIDDILARGNIPILVGGSMLYISAVTDGYVFTGRGGKRVAPISYDLFIFGLQRPRGELVKRIEERTKKLLGMEVCCVTLRCEPQRATKGDMRCMVRGSALSLAPHHDKQKNPQTWLSEVESLLSRGYTISDPGMESHGYREIAQWILRGRKTAELPALIKNINAATRQYAKRQMTWWKHDERIHWILRQSSE